MMSLPPLQDLLDLLPDNTSGDITPFDMREIVTTLYDGIDSSLDTLSNYINVNGLTLMANGYTPTSPLGVTTKEYVDNVDQTNVSRSGDTMTGDLILPVLFTTNPRAAVPKDYVDQVVGSINLTYLPLSGGRLTGRVLSSLATNPNSFDELVNKQYVDDRIIDVGGGNVSTSLSNTYLVPTTQAFDSATANEISVNGYDLEQAAINSLEAIDKANTNEAAIANLQIEIDNIDLSNVAFVDQENTFDEKQRFNDRIVLENNGTPDSIGQLELSNQGSSSGVFENETIIWKRDGSGLEVIGRIGVDGSFLLGKNTGVGGTQYGLQTSLTGGELLGAWALSDLIIDSEAKSANAIAFKDASNTFTLVQTFEKSVVLDNFGQSFFMFGSGGQNASGTLKQFVNSNDQFVMQCHNGVGFTTRLKLLEGGEVELLHDGTNAGAGLITASNGGALRGNWDATNFRFPAQGNGLFIAGTNGDQDDGRTRLYINSSDQTLFTKRVGGADKAGVVLQPDGGVELRYDGNTSGKGLITTNTGGDLRGLWAAQGSFTANGDIRLLTRGTAFELAGDNGVDGAGAAKLTLDVNSSLLLRHHVLGAFKSQIVSYPTSGEVELRCNGGNTNQGLITTNTGGNLRGTWTGTVTSDARYKENITPVSGLDNILQLNGVSWDFIEGHEIEGADTTGFTAQNWQNVYPDQVIENDEGKLQIVRSLNTQVFEADVVESIKQLHDIITQQQALIDQLDTQLQLLTGEG